MDSREKPQDLARRLAEAARNRKSGQSRPPIRSTDGYRRETFALPREAARAKARELLQRFPKAAYMTEIESWRELPDGGIEFTMRRLPTAD